MLALRAKRSGRKTGRTFRLRLSEMREFTHVQCFLTGNGNWSFDDLKRVTLRSCIDDIAIWHAAAFDQNICRSAFPWIERVL